MKKRTFTIVIIIAFAGVLHADSFKDAFISYKNKNLIARIDRADSINFGRDEINSYCYLSDGKDHGEITFIPDTAEAPFNRLLPSWNGQVFNENSTFKIQIRFAKNGSWSPWLSVGFWKNHIWSDYGSTSFADGRVDIDYVKLHSYYSIYQFRVIIGRIFPNSESPRLHKLSAYLSDSRRTGETDYTALENDRPPQILIDTEHYYQYDLDDNIGGDICSPTTVSMILGSYHIEVEPVSFARATKDPIYSLFGVWPRVVQNAHEYGLDGAVTRYRNWSECYRVLAAGGRIGMSLGPPLYSGHLVMLAGFDENGDPLVHDPARRDGYAHHFNKNSLAESWFSKGGIAYTFYLEDSSRVVTSVSNGYQAEAAKIELGPNYPNPFNSNSRIPYRIPETGKYLMSLSDISGKILYRKAVTLAELEGEIELAELMPIETSSGIYLFNMKGRGFSASARLSYLK